MASTQQMVFDGVTIESREKDHFINATQMCKAGGKLFADWSRLSSTKELIRALQLAIVNENSDMGIPITLLADEGVDSEIFPEEILPQLIESINGNSTKFAQGSWVHPDLAVPLAQWISPVFAIQVSRWIRELLITGSVSIDSKKTDKELNELLIKQLKEAQNNLIERDMQIAERDIQLAISNSKIVNLVDKIQDVTIFKPDGYIYLITCKQYAANNHYRLGRTNDLKKRMSVYNCGRTLDDQMYQLFEYKTAQVNTLEYILRQLLKPFRQKDAMNKDIYVMHIDDLRLHVQNQCDNFNNVSIYQTNKLIKANNVNFTHNSINDDNDEDNDEDEDNEESCAISNFMDSDSEDIDGDPDLNESKSDRELLIESRSYESIITEVYFCSVCADNFDSESSMNKHAKFHVLPTVSVPVIVMQLPCIKCNKTFATKALLEKHLEKKIPCDRSKNSTCLICAHTFRDYHDLNKHMNKVNSCSPTSSSLK